MTNEEAKVFLDNLKICIDEHPVVADWLVEIANRKVEPNSSENPNNCETCGTPKHLCQYCIAEDRMWTPKDEDVYPCDTCKHNKLEWFSEVCDGCCGAHSNYEPKTEPQTELVNDSPILVKDLVDDEFNPYDDECMRCKHLKLKCEWIPCSERLPTLSEDGTSDAVLLCWSDGQVTVGAYQGNRTFCGQAWPEAKDCRVTVVAWMPLPPAWKGADDEAD